VARLRRTSTAIRSPLPRNNHPARPLSPARRPVARSDVDARHARGHNRGSASDSRVAVPATNGTCTWHTTRRTGPGICACPTARHRPDGSRAVRRVTVVDDVALDRGRMRHSSRRAGTRKRPPTARAPPPAMISPDDLGEPTTRSFPQWNTVDRCRAEVSGACSVHESGRTTGTITTVAPESGTSSTRRPTTALGPCRRGHEQQTRGSLRQGPADVSSG